MFISESEALRLVFSEDVRPSLQTFRQYSREARLPCYRFGKRTVYAIQELEEAVKKLTPPKRNP